MIPVITRALAASSTGDRTIALVADTRQLQALAAKVKRLGPNNPHIRAGLQEVAALWENRIKANFRRSINPYGQKWPDIKHRQGQPLINTGMLRNSISGEVRGLSIVLGSPLEYADIHQNGTRVKQRMFLPSKERGLPDKWKNEYVKILIKNVEKALA
ncbi:phage virion morphogenesis protein [Pseudomonas putida]|uniref:phage virion morphogenesis protein n=1 Tax=Pseudomonas putida TaxID=303 RepID=UPI0021694444|nr:phage virion morphogenesis protein [Pseudomonas putida]MCS4061725.1 phage gpG-like protein [Pseudomonas putida]